MLYRLSQGHSFAGTPPGWVPTLSIRVVQEFLALDLLPSLKVVEDAQNRLLDKQ